MLKRAELGLNLLIFWRIFIIARVCILDYEYQERIQRAAKLFREKGFDVMVVARRKATMQTRDIFQIFGPYLKERA